MPEITRFEKAMSDELNPTPFEKALVALLAEYEALVESAPERGPVIQHLDDIARNGLSAFLTAKMHLSITIEQQQAMVEARREAKQVAKRIIQEAKEKKHVAELEEAREFQKKMLDRVAEAKDMGMK